MAVSEIFLSAFITVVFEKLASADLLRFARQQGIYTELNKWLTTLYQIRSVLGDAEEKQISDTAVKMWLEHLADLAYDLDDILDKISTEASIRNLKTDQAASTSTTTNVIMSFIHTYSPNSIRRSFMVDRKMRSEIDEISTRLEQLFNLKSSLGLEERVMGSSNNRLPQRPPTTSCLVEESHVFGRESDKGVIVEMLLKEAHEEEANPEEVFSVIPIIGMGGVGKTTLAQLVYNHHQLTDRFHLKAWVCVSLEFDVFMITKMILESVTGKSTKFSTLNELQVSLKELSKKRFLLVLDDVWNNNYPKWDLLCGPLRAGAPGSKIIVTTRDKHVASTMSRVPAYPLNVLEDNDCLSLLSQHALGTRNFDAHSNLKVIGEAIVRNCKGLPLAAKALGGVLRADLSPKYWKEIMTSKIWDIPEEECGILSALRLSYNHLPSHLKQLFAYCSILPYDCEFDMDELVLLWMAEGFLQQPEGGKPMEELGCKYFNELLSRSFFQRSSGSESRFVMHDVMNDLAQVIAGKICFRLDSNTQSTEKGKVLEKARHISFIRQKYEVFQKFKALNGIKGLRTFLPLPMRKLDFVGSYLSNGVLVDLLPKLQCLRVLSLNGYNIRKIPESVGDLKQLRYLNLSETMIDCLPESVTDLYNLQTLLLRGCRWLTKLPAGIGNLSNLRHLDCMDTMELRGMPAGIGKLTNLRTLSKIALAENGLQVSDLSSLSEIRETLTIEGLHTVRNIQDVMEANLLGKHGLDEVVMEWSASFDHSQSRSLEKDVLDGLQPHRNLKKLRIKFYGGTEFPKWVGDTSFSSIVDLELLSCEECNPLPSLGQLPLLRNLYINGFRRVTSVGAEFYGAGCPLTVAFPSLETLNVVGMPNWEEWSSLTGVEVFPCLRKLRISHCPSLIKVSLLRLPSLRVLELSECPELVLRCMVRIATITTLTVNTISGLTGLQKNITEFLGALENLTIRNCTEMTSLLQEESAWKSLISLRKLDFWGSLQLVSLAGESGVLPQNLEFLSISHGYNLEKLPSGLNSLTSLKDFRISDCPRIVCCPDTGLPPMLTRLEIRSCKALEVPTCSNERMVMQNKYRVINSGNDGEGRSNTENSSHLEILAIADCSSLTSFPTGNLPSTLKELYVLNCTKLEPDVEKSLYNCMLSLERLSIVGWLNIKTLPTCFYSFRHLTWLYIRNCPALESFPECGLPLNLRTLEIKDCANLELLPDQIKSLTSLEDLSACYCPRLISFPQGGFPPNLKGLQLEGLELVCFPGECLFPTSLRRLHIEDAVNLESLFAGLQNLPSLEELDIRKCPKLQSLPNTLLSALSCLDIVNCPLLKARCLKERGEYWPLIAPIPRVSIDHRDIHWL